MIEWKYFSETDHNQSSAGSRDTNDIEKVTGSKVKVIKSIPEILLKTVEEYPPTERRRLLSSCSNKKKTKQNNRKLTYWLCRNTLWFLTDRCA